MKITIDQTRAALIGFNQTVDQPLLAKTAYWVNKLGKRLDEINQIAEKVLEPVRNDEKAYLEAYASLKEIEEEVFDHKFTIDDFEGSKVNTFFFQQIAPFLKEE